LAYSESQSIENLKKNLPVHKRHHEGMTGIGALHNILPGVGLYSPGNPHQYLALFTFMLWSRFLGLIMHKNVRWPGYHGQ